MDAIDTSLLPELSKLIEGRLALLRNLAESLESGSLALARNDAEAIARVRRIRQSSAGNGAFSKTSSVERRDGVRRRHRPAHPAVPRKPTAPRGCKPSGRRSELGSVISRECTGRCCGTCSAAWQS